MHITIVPNYLLTGIDICCVHFYVQCRWYWGYNVPYVSSTSTQGLKPDSEQGGKLTVSKTQYLSPRPIRFTVLQRRFTSRGNYHPAVSNIKCGGWCHSLINVFLTYRM